MKSQKGTSLIIVFIVCTAIAILLSTSFIVIGNYHYSVVSRKRELVKIVSDTGKNISVPEVDG